MNTLPDQEMSLIGWNGLRLQSPSSWETIVSGHNHLIFEDDFEPILQIRWKNVGPVKESNWAKKSEEWWQLLELTSKEVSLPPALTPLKDSFSHLRYFRGKGPMESGGICYCRQCHTLIVFQLLSTTGNVLEKTAHLLSSLACHEFKSTLWRIQDFSLKTPRKLQLTDYSFKAGLSRLSFSSTHYSLQVCRLAQAKERLATDSLENILLTLTGTQDLVPKTSQDSLTCHASRCPGILRQVLLRLRKEKPFIEARLWQVPERNRLLATLISSKRPIADTDILHCYEHFEII